MNDGRRRGVTRGYTWGLIFAAAFTGFALVLAAWAFISLDTGGGAVSTPGVSMTATTPVLLVCLAALVWGMWLQSVTLLRGRRAPSWPHVLSVGFGGYLLWCLAGTAIGLRLEDTWLSPYAVSLGVAWVLAAILQWALLARRVYTDRPTPQWPWEARGEPGPDWANTGENPWGGTNEPGSDGNRDRREDDA